MITVDIKLLGMPELEAALAKLEPAVQKKVLRQAMRASAKRLRSRVVTNVSGLKVEVQTGRLRRGFARAPIRSRTRRGFTRVGFEFPTRESLGIRPEDPYYWPIALEYGHRRPGGGFVRPHPFVRPAVDEHRGVELAIIGREVGRGIERVAPKAKEP